MVRIIHAPSHGQDTSCKPKGTKCATTSCIRTIRVQCSWRTTDVDQAAREQDTSICGASLWQMGFIRRSYEWRIAPRKRCWPTALRSHCREHCSGFSVMLSSTSRLRMVQRAFNLAHRTTGVCWIRLLKDRHGPKQWLGVAQAAALAKQWWSRTLASQSHSNGKIWFVKQFNLSVLQQIKEMTV